ncbi:4a-hydroxytetrahydrobiopterin dehydratase [Leptospira fainei]|nr:4a-hydroxytetrahydrobiopterin dehydratase [Leptospira fainei]
MSSTRKMDPEEIRKNLPDSWEVLPINGVYRIRKNFTFSTYSEGIRFVNEVAREAERLDHHPDLRVTYGNVGLEVFTHSLNGLSNLDLELALFSEKAYKRDIS